MKDTVKTVPALPGVYFFKDIDGKVVYIGKAKSLKSRVSSYFRADQPDWKARSLLEEACSLDYILTKNETEALLLEAELISTHKPKFNVIFKDGNPFLYIFFTSNAIPKMEIVRSKKRKGTYFGPFMHKQPARKVYNFLMRMFKLNLCNKKIANGCLDYHLDKCPGNCMPGFDMQDYVFRIELAKKALRNNHRQFIKSLEEKIDLHNREFAFEKARMLNELLANFERIFDTIRTHYNPEKFDAEIFVATTPLHYMPEDALQLAKEIQQFVGTLGLVRTIDCFDVSHFQSRSIVGSCVRFTDGKPDKNWFRRFKIRTLTQQNDYAALQEIVARRYRDPADLPDLIIIDGGKGQLNAITPLFPDASIVSLAKREETLFGLKHPDGIKLDIKTPVGKLIIAIRDYAHHFAITYHRLRSKKSVKEL